MSTARYIGPWQFDAQQYVNVNNSVNASTALNEEIQWSYMTYKRVNIKITCVCLFIFCFFIFLFIFFFLMSEFVHSRIPNEKETRYVSWCNEKTLNVLWQCCEHCSTNATIPLVSQIGIKYLLYTWHHSIQLGTHKCLDVCSCLHLDRMYVQNIRLKQIVQWALLDTLDHDSLMYSSND